MDIIIVLFAGLILICIGLFIYNLVRSLAYTAKAVGAHKAKALGEQAVTHAERMAQLPTLPLPADRYSRKHGRIRIEDVPCGEITYLLDKFEERVILAKVPKLFYGRIAPGKGFDDTNRSMLVGFQSAIFTRFLGWITLEKMGSHIEWTFMCSEVRLFRTPAERDSHFEYGPHQHERYESRSRDDNKFLIMLWDLVFSNMTTAEHGKAAEWFERFINEMWGDAVDETSLAATDAHTSALPPPVAGFLQVEPGAATESIPVRRRPARRD